MATVSWAVTPDEEEGKGTTWGDWGKAAAVGVGDVASGALGATRYLAEKAGPGAGSDLFDAGAKYLQNQLHNAQDDAVSSMSPDMQRNLSAQIGSPEWWDAPFSSTLSKVVRSSPSILASIGATIAAPEFLPAIVTMGATSGGLSAGQTLDQIYSELDAKSDTDLRKLSTLYDSMRSQGVSEDEARKKFNDAAIGNKPAMLFALGAITGAVGPEAQVGKALGLKGLGEAAEGTVLGRAAKGAAVGGATEGLQGGSEQLTQEQTEVDAGLKPSVDVGAVAAATADNALIGAALGAPAEAISGHKPKTVKNDPKNVTPPGNTGVAAPAPAEPSTPAKTAPVTATPVTSPTPSPVQAAKGTTAKQTSKARKPKIVVAPPGTLAPDEAAALAAATPAPVPPSMEGNPTVTGLDTAPTPVVEGSQPNEVAQVVPPVAAPFETAPAPATTPAPLEQNGLPSPAAQAPTVAPEPAIGAGPSATPEAPSVPPATPAPSIPPEVQAAAARLPTAEPKADTGPTSVATDARKAQPTDTASEGPRVLQSLKPRDVAQREEAAKANAELVSKNIEQMAKEEAGPQGKNRSKADVAKREQDAATAKQLFDTHVPKSDVIPTTVTQKAALFERLAEINKAAEDAGVTVPTKVGYEGTPDHIVWLREVKDMLKAFGNKRGPMQDQLSSFLIRERSAREGDFSVMRGERKAEGELQSRSTQGDVETMSAAGPDEEKNAVLTSVPKSARRSINALDEERAAEAAPVKKVAVTPEVAAKAMAALEAAAKRAKSTDEAPALLEKAKPKTPTQVLASEVKKVDRNPTEAEKVAGNYRMAHIKVDGHDISIETPKGAKRRGTGPDGKPWEVVSPAHYGYIKRTVGADGDHVDVYVGEHRDSDHVFVIDQRHIDGPKVGEFDEHKAMLGFNTVREAVETYAAGYSDKRGMDRISDIRTMTTDEFKHWVNSSATKRAAGDPVIARQAEQEARTGSTPEERAVSDAVEKRSFAEQHRQTPSAARMAPIETTAGAALEHLDLTHLGDTLPGKLAQFARRRLYEVARNVPLHVVDEPTMLQLTGRDLTGQRAPRGFYDHGGDYIVVQVKTLAEPDSAARIILHETIHAATGRAINDSPKFRQTIRMMMSETLAALEGAQYAEHNYAFTDEHEFMAEAMSEPRFQQVLSQVDMSPELAARLNMANIHKPTLWDAFIGSIRRMLGMPPGTNSMIEGVIRTSDQLFKPRADDMMKQGTFRRVSSSFKEEDDASLLKSVASAIKEVTTRPEMQAQAGVSKLLPLHTLDYIARESDRFMGKDNPVRTISDLLERQGVRSQQILGKSEKLINDLYAAEKKHLSSGEWDKFSSLVHDETMASVFADRPLDVQSHLGKDTLKGNWSKAQHADLAARYAALDPELKDLRARAMQFFTDQQNEMNFGLLKNNILAVLGVHDDAMAQRIFDGTHTEADLDALGPAAEAVLDVKELSKIDGPYFPLDRHGDHVVQGTYEVTPPTGPGVTIVDPTTFDFDNRKAALAYSSKLDQRPTVSSRWIDATTGKNYIVDPTDGKQYRVTPNDINAVQRFRVQANNKHVEFFQTERSARVAAAQLEKSGMTVDGVQDKRVEPHGLSMDLTSRQMQTLAASLENRKGFQDMTPQQQNELRQGLIQASLRFMGSTRIQSRRLPRAYIQGASKDLTLNTWNYAKSTAGYLAKLETAPELQTAMNNLRKAVDNKDFAKETSQARSRIANEVEKRVWNNNGFQEQGAISRGIRRVLALSFIDKLASVSYSMANATQPAMVTGPVLAGRHGMGRAFGAMSKAYNDIGAGSRVVEGVKSSWNKARRPGVDGSNFINNVLNSQKLTAGERKMMETLITNGRIDPEAGIEIGSLLKQRDAGTVGGRVMSGLDTSIGYFEGISRQMPKAIETINRTVSALAAFRLEMARNGGDVEAATRYASDVVAQTQFLYSGTNAPPVLNHPLARLAFQFKKFGMAMYQLLGEQVGKVVHNTNPGDRAEAIRTLGYLAATHVIMAGTLGLPTEPIKALVLGANMAGLTDFTWADVEAMERKAAADMFGATAGEMLTRGVTRGLPGGFAFDLSSRLGLDNMMLFGEPKTNSTDDVFNWFAQMAAGAPGGLARDWHSGVNSLVGGDFLKGAEKLLPLKTLSDAIHAYRTLSEGKTNKRGEQTFQPYSIGEAVTRGLGFTPGREVEAGDMQSTYYRESQRAKDAHNSWLTQWSSAGPNERARLWGKIEAWNRTQPKDARLTRSALDSYVKTQKTKKVGGAISNGLYTPKKSDKAAEKALEGIYND